MSSHPRATQNDLCCLLLLLLPPHAARYAIVVVERVLLQLVSMYLMTRGPGPLAHGWMTHKMQNGSTAAIVLKTLLYVLQLLLLLPLLSLHEMMTSSLLLFLMRPGSHTAGAGCVILLLLRHALQRPGWSHRHPHWQ